MSTNEPTELEKIPGIGPKRARALRVAGFQTLEDLEEVSEEELRSVEMIDDILARDIKATVSPSEGQTSATKQLNQITPAEWQITEQQVTHIRRLADDVSVDLAGRTAADIRDELEWVIEPELLGFRQVCGRVVKEDPETGDLHPVPNATVHVEDTDCSFLSYFPDGVGYGWFFPYGCTREEIATTTTNECGRFCVYVPRWDIDRVLEFRRERVCLPDIHKPRLRDILENPRVLPEPVFPPEPRPRPDPGPIGLQEPGVFERLSELVGQETVQRLDASMELQSFGDSRRETDELLDRPAFLHPPDPPLPDGFSLTDPAERAERLEDVPVDPEVLQEIDPEHTVGPFLECSDVFVPEWRTFVDVPDITFRVTQDVDGDGTEETIYSEGYFDVRWDADSIPDVELVADSDAISIPTCEGLTPENVECEEPSIETVGLMPAESPYHDRNSGYSPRLNRPKPNGTRPSGTAPYAGTLQLHGCHRFEEAEYYRLLYSYEGNSEKPFTGHEWHAPAIGRDPVHVQPDDSDGWYPILDVPYLENYYGESLGDNPLIMPFWLLNWNTRRYENGNYTVRLELGDDSKNALGTTSPEVAFEVDNRSPNLHVDSLVWGKMSEPVAEWDNDITDECPLIRRPAGTDIGIKVTFRAWSKHFRDVRISAHGCNRSPTLHQPSTSGGSSNRYSYWHSSVGDRSHTKTVVFKVPGTYQQGSYRISLRGFSRAFNPAGSGTGPGSNWRGDPGYIDSHLSRLISIVDT